MAELPFVEKYRPESLEDIVGDSGTEALKAFAKTGLFPLAIILYGSYGTGKTARARALTRDYYVQNGLYLPSATFRDIRSGSKVSPEYEGIFPPVLYVDAAVTRDIDFIKDTVQTFMKRVPPKGLKKIIIFDEADRLSFDAQRALRPMIEKYPNTVTIYTTNELDKIDAAIQDRAAGATFEVRYPGSEFVAQYLKKLATKEGVEIPDDKLQQIAVESESVRQAVGKLGTEITIYRAQHAPLPTPSPAVKTYEDLKREFEGKDLVDALAVYVSTYQGLKRDYLLEDLNRFLRELRAKLSTEDLYRFYKAYPRLQVEFASIASMISWVPPNVPELERAHAIVEEAKKPAAPPPAPLGLSEEQKKRLEDAFKRVFEEANVRPIPLATFRDELDRLQEDLRTVERGRAYDLALKDIIDVAQGILPKRAPELIPAPTAPPTPRLPREVTVPPSEMLGPRRRDVMTLQCWVPDCLEQCIVDKDLMRRVSMVPVMKAWGPRGVRYEPLLALPPLFFYSCESHRHEKFGYRSVYDVLAYLLFESRSSTKRMTVTKGTFVDVGLDADDLVAIQMEEAKWIAGE